jgi:hypothetical protein
MLTNLQTVKDRVKAVWGEDERLPPQLQACKKALARRVREIRIAHVADSDEAQVHRVEITEG